MQQIMLLIGIPRTGFGPIFPEVNEPHLLTKRAQLDLLFINNQHFHLSSTTIKTMISASNDSSISAAYITLTKKSM